MKQKRVYNILFWLAGLVSKLFYPMKVVGRDNIPDGPVILCPNHSNLLDPFLITYAMGKGHFVHHMAKAESRKIPIFGKVMETIGSIFVRRGETDIESIRKSIKVLRAGEKLMIFPEGTRVHGDDVVQPKAGVIRIAAKQNVPILPVYLPRDKKMFCRFPVVFGEPYRIESASHEDYAAQAEELMRRIWALKERG